MLRAGLGWGSLPRHMARAYLADGSLIELRLERWAGTGDVPQLNIVVACRDDQALGPAGQWLYRALAVMR